MPESTVVPLRSRIEAALESNLYNPNPVGGNWTVGGIRSAVDEVMAVIHQYGPPTERVNPEDFDFRAARERATSDE